MRKRNERSLLAEILSVDKGGPYPGGGHRMAGLFYPASACSSRRRAAPGTELSETFKIMEKGPPRQVMAPAMITTWIFGITLALTPGLVDWGNGVDL